MRGGKHHFFYPLDTIVDFVNIKILSVIRSTSGIDTDELFT